MEFIPKNAFEQALVSAKSGAISIEDFVKVLMASDVAIPSKTEVRPDSSGFQPLMLEKAGKFLVECFTDMERIGDIGKIAPYCLVMKGEEFLKWLPNEYGILINPGHSVGAEISAAGLAQIISKF